MTLVLSENKVEDKNNTVTIMLKYECKHSKKQYEKVKPIMPSWRDYLCISFFFKFFITYLLLLSFKIFKVLLIYTVIKVSHDK